MLEERVAGIVALIAKDVKEFMLRKANLDNLLTALDKHDGKVFF
jgi:hypothetical protein